MLNRKTWKKYRKIFFYIIILLLGACASPSHPPASTSPLHEQGFFKRTPSDTDLFQGGVSYLGSSEQPADYVKARTAFDTLVKTYPESKWKGLSITLIRLIDERQLCQTKNILADKVQGDRERLLQESEKFRRDIKNLQTEMMRLSQENEQLKQDIQLLKNLEIQLDKREKMYR
jgi:hypothetical protein